jgi:anti-sigma factor RsiW
MTSPDHTIFRNLLDLELDGCLSAEQQARLDGHLAGCPDCRAERSELLAMAGLFERSRLTVQPGFRDRVMESLPAAGWESRHPRTWTFPAAVFAALLAAGAGLLGAGSARLGSAYGVFSALAGLLRAAVVAGIGFTTASWRWVAMFVEQLLASPVSLVIFGVFVICLNLVLFSLVRRRRGAHASPASPASRPASAAAARRRQRRRRGGTAPR